MGTKERREREKQEIRGKILDAARELFATSGYEAVTMRMVAEKIEYSPTTIYLHWKDKQELLHEICMSDFGALADVFQRISRVADPVERLKKIGMAYVKFAQEHPHHYRLMFMTPLPHPSVDPQHDGKGNPERDAYAFLRVTVEQAIAEGRIRPDLKDPDLVTQIAWAGVHGIVSLHLAMGTSPWVEWRPLKRTAETAIDLLITGLVQGAPLGR